jgi:hypothetical protein
MRIAALFLTVTVSVPMTIVRLVPNTADMKTTCATTHHVYACTAFAGQRLVGTCTPDAGQWRMSVRAQYIPVLYLSSSAYRHHEALHIQDIDASLKRYLDALVRLPFASERDCEAAAADAMRGFDATMDQFKIDSNALRHPHARPAYHPMM